MSYNKAQPQKAITFGAQYKLLHVMFTCPLSLEVVKSIKCDRDDMINECM